MGTVTARAHCQLAGHSEKAPPPPCGQAVDRASTSHRTSALAARWRPAPRPPSRPPAVWVYGSPPLPRDPRLTTLPFGPGWPSVPVTPWTTVKRKGLRIHKAQQEKPAQRGLSPGRHLAEDGTAPGNARKSDPKESLDRLGVNGAARPQHPVRSPAFSENRARGWPWGSHSPYCPPTEPRQKELRQKHGLPPPSRMFQDAAGGGQCFPGRSQASRLPFRTAQAVCGKGTKPVAAEVQGQEFPLWLRG